MQSVSQNEHYMRADMSDAVRSCDDCEVFAHPKFAHSKPHLSSLGDSVILLCRSRGEQEKATSAQVQSKVPSKVVENIRQLPPVLLMEED